MGLRPFISPPHTNDAKDKYHNNDKPRNGAASTLIEGNFSALPTPSRSSIAAEITTGLVLLTIWFRVNLCVCAGRDEEYCEQERGGKPRAAEASVK
jgi:hypothetical protein